MKLSIQKLNILNFKGIQRLDIDFMHITNVRGENGTGKSTVYDAFLWLLFGKNAAGVQDFSIKPRDASGREIQKTEVEVSAEFIVNDSQRVVFKKVYREKWTKKQGSPIAEYTGNENIYYWNDVPLKESEYKTKVSELIPETTFRMVTSTNYFNTLNWQDQRKTLLLIAGDISDRDVAATNPDFDALIAEMAGKTFDEFKAMIAAKKAKLKKELEQIPIRIDQMNRSMPLKQDWASMRSAIVSHETRIKEIDEILADANKQQVESQAAIRIKNSQLHDLKLKLQNAEGKLRADFANALSLFKNSVQSLKFELSGKQAEYNQNTTAYLQAEKDVARYDQDMSIYRKYWNEENEKTFVFDETKCTCPTCGQALPAGEVSETRTKLETAYNENKAKVLKGYQQNGFTAKSQKEQSQTRADALRDANMLLQSAIDDLNLRIVSASEKLQSNTETADEQFRVALDTTPELVSLRAQIKTLADEILPANGDAGSSVDNTAIKTEKANLNAAINTLRTQLADEGTITRNNKMIADLNDEQQKFAQSLMELEGKEFTIAEFDRAKMDVLESKINGMFQVVTFQLFERQVNGAEKPTCIALVNGVPWKDANTAAKVNAGLDIINVISRYHHAQAPIFVDAREGVNELIEVDSQIVNLIVAPKGTPLEITFD